MTFGRPMSWSGEGTTSRGNISDTIVLEALEAIQEVRASMCMDIKLTLTGPRKDFTGFALR
jgi:hypothetical protein